MKTLNLYEAKTHLSALVEEAAAGEEIIIAKNGKPMARLVSVENVRRRREPGGWEGQVQVSDDFDAPLPDDIIDLFYADDLSLDGDEEEKA